MIIAGLGIISIRYAINKWKENQYLLDRKLKAETLEKENDVNLKIQKSLFETNAERRKLDLFEKHNNTKLKLEKV